jgi:hypothetical protein
VLRWQLGGVGFWTVKKQNKTQDLTDKKMAGKTFGILCGPINDKVVVSQWWGLLVCE